MSSYNKESWSHDFLQYLSDMIKQFQQEKKKPSSLGRQTEKEKE